MLGLKRATQALSGLRHRARVGPRVINPMVMLCLTLHLDLLQAGTLMILMTSGEVLDDEARESSGFASLVLFGRGGLHHDSSEWFRGLRWDVR